jgi:hypothetical protein
MVSFWYRLGEIIAPVVLALATFIMAQLSGFLQRKQKPHKPLEHLFRIDAEIKLALERARHELGAMRVYLSQYMDGDKYLSETDVVKKVRTHEVIEPRFSPQQENFRGMLLSDIPEETALVMQEGPSFTLVSSIPYSKFRWLCEQGGAKAIARWAVRNEKKEIVGLIGADFDDVKEPKNISALGEAVFEVEQLLKRIK